MLKIGMSRQGKTITKVVFSTVSTRLRIYQARTALRGQTTGIYMNEDLTKAHERLCYMTHLLFNDKAIAKNWTFLGKIYIKKTLESDVIEITKKEDLIEYDVNNVLQEHNLL